VADRNVDVLIVGGGLTGATLMLALTGLGYRTLLVEAKAFTTGVPDHFDARTLALAPATVRILDKLHVWPLLRNNITTIDSIHVSEQSCFGHTIFQREKDHPLGYVVEMQYIYRALHQLLEHQYVMAPARVTELNHEEGSALIHSDGGMLRVQAELIVAADGSDSFVRELCGLPTQIKDYQQHAVVANIGLARSHEHRAYERFTSSGPLALLPMTEQRSSLVWSLRPDDAKRMMACSQSDFLMALQRAFGYRLGRFVKVGERVLYPLRQVLMRQQVTSKVVFVGNAAHTLHPVAGQGFNLGLRDVAMLAQCIAHEGLTMTMLSHYQQARHKDQVAITRLTDGLVDWFTCSLPGLSLIRSAGLIALNHTPFLKNGFTRYACGFGGTIPDLVCGLPLRNLHETVL
jgi:2-octaprenyl-6-methoxyphenol hydroxylase